MRLDPKNSSKLKKLTKKIITWTWTGNWQYNIKRDIINLGGYYYSMGNWTIFRYVY